MDASDSKSAESNSALDPDSVSWNVLTANYDFFSSTAQASEYKGKIYEQYEEIQETCADDYSALCSADDSESLFISELFQLADLFSSNSVISEYSDAEGSATVVSSVPMDEYIIIEGTDDVNEISIDEMSLVNDNNPIFSILFDFAPLVGIPLLNNDDYVVSEDNTRRKLVQSRAVIPSLSSALAVSKKGDTTSKLIRPVSEEVVNKPNKLIDYHNTIQYGGTNPMLKGPGGVRKPPSHVAIKPVTTDNVVHDHVMKHEPSHGARNLKGKKKSKKFNINHIKEANKAHSKAEDSGVPTNVDPSYSSKVADHQPDSFNGYLGYGTTGDICMYHNFQGLSPKCQNSIKGLYAIRDDYLTAIEASSSDDGFGFFGFIFWLTVILLAIRVTKRYISRDRRHQMKQILLALNNNAELKSAVERESGVAVPPVPEYGSRSTLFNIVKFLGLFFCTTLLVFLIITTTVFFGVVIMNIGSSSSHPAASYVVGALLTVLVIGAFYGIVKGVSASFSFCYSGNNRGPDDSSASASAPSQILQSIFGPRVLPAYLTSQGQYSPLLQQDQHNNGAAEMITYNQTSIQPTIQPAAPQSMYVSSTPSIVPAYNPIVTRSVNMI